MTSKKPETYSNLLSLDNEVKKKPKPPLKKLNVAAKIESSKDNKRSRSRSPKNKKMKSSNYKVPKEIIDWDIPDRQYGDLYCKPCDAHMNSEQMWEAHISGKRHLKHLKKGESGDLKYDYIDDEDPIMIDEINAEKRCLVGLQHVVEIQRLEQRPIYQCFLCSANVPSAELLLDHIVGIKHRLAYLKEHDPERYDLVKKSNLKKGHIEPVVEESIMKHEAAIGRGKMLVKREREDYKSPPRKSYKPDYVSSSKLTRSNRSPDFDVRRSQRDRSFDKFDDHSSQGRFADRDNSHYNRSDDLAESYKRSGYNDSEKRKFDEDRYGDSRFPLGDVYGSLLSDDKYGSSRPSVAEDRYGSSRLSVAEDRYGSSRPFVADERYGISRALVADDRYGSSRPSVADDRYDSSRPSVADDRYSNLNSVIADDRYGRSLVEEEKNVRYRTSLDEDRYGDLRQVLEKKKTSTEPYRTDNGASYTISDSYLGSKDISSFSAIKGAQENTYSKALGNITSTGNNTLAEMTSNMPGAYLKMIEAMNPTVFLQLALFKINRIEIDTEFELQLLNKLSSRSTSLALEIKQNQLKEACPSELKEEFKESMVMQGLGVSPQFAKDYKKIVEMVGQAKAMSKPVNSGESSAQQLKYEEKYSNPIYHATTDKHSATHQRSSPVYSSADKISGFSWQHVDSTQAQPGSSTNYSAAAYIPGLTLANAAPDPPLSSSPFDLLSRQTKDILGGIRTKTDSYRY